MFGRLLVALGLVLVLFSAWVMPMNSVAFADPPGEEEEEAASCSPGYCALSPGTCYTSFECTGTCRTTGPLCSACTTCVPFEAYCYCIK